MAYIFFSYQHLTPFLVYNMIDNVSLPYRPIYASICSGPPPLTHKLQICEYFL